MYHILVVDDSRVERDCILFLINKYRLPLTTHTACNGKEALALLEKREFDILFTDVKMPFLDGLQLTEAALALHRSLKVVIFSGYHEFEYAKTAIRLGVSEYLLKPIDPEEFSVTVSRVVDELDQRAENRTLQARRLDLVKRHLLLMLINSVPERELSRESSAPIPLDFLREYSRMVLLEFAGDFFAEAGLEFEHYLREHLDLPLDYLNVSPSQSLLFLKEKVELSLERLVHILQELAGSVERDHRRTMYCAVEERLRGTGIGSAYRRLEELMEKRFFYPNRRVFYHSMERAGEASHEDPVSLELMEADIRHRDYPALRGHLSYVFSSLREMHGYSELYVKFLFSSIIREILLLLPDEHKSALSTNVEKVYLGDNIQHLEEIVFEAVDLLEAHVPPPTPHATRVELVREFIHRHYDQDLSLDRLAGEVYVHPDYLSRIFKQETGQTLNKFIKAYRMKKAKELLGNSPMKIQAVCKAVGYQNFSYFCQSFRDYYGVSPEKMRQGKADHGS